GQFGTLLDDRLALVGGQYARRRDHLAALVGFEGGDLEVQEAGQARAEQADREARGGGPTDVRGRQVDEVGVVDPGRPADADSAQAIEARTHLGGEVGRTAQVARDRRVAA